MLYDYQAGFGSKKKVSRQNDLNFNRYVVIRAGHTVDLLQPLVKNIFAKTLKKDRKLLLYGFDKHLVNDLASKIYRYRTPSVYTGRGVRKKHCEVLKKAGKKDKQKGKIF
jgi:ribosomal protein L6P/L9E